MAIRGRRGRREGEERRQYGQRRLNRCPECPLTHPPTAAPTVQPTKLLAAESWVAEETRRCPKFQYHQNNRTAAKNMCSVARAACTAQRSTHLFSVSSSTVYSTPSNCTFLPADLRRRGRARAGFGSAAGRATPGTMLCWLALWRPAQPCTCFPVNRRRARLLAAARPLRSRSAACARAKAPSGMHAALSCAQTRCPSSLPLQQCPQGSCATSPRSSRKRPKLRCRSTHPELTPSAQHPPGGGQHLDVRVGEVALVQHLGRKQKTSGGGGGWVSG